MFQKYRDESGSEMKRRDRTRQVQRMFFRCHLHPLNADLGSWWLAVKACRRCSARLLPHSERTSSTELVHLTCASHVKEPVSQSGHEAQH